MDIFFLSLAHVFQKQRFTSDFLVTKFKDRSHSCLLSSVQPALSPLKPPISQDLVCALCCRSLGAWYRLAPGWCSRIPFGGLGSLSTPVPWVVWSAAVALVAAPEKGAQRLQIGQQQERTPRARRCTVRVMLSPAPGGAALAPPRGRLSESVLRVLYASAF